MLRLDPRHSVALEKEGTYTYQNNQDDKVVMAFEAIPADLMASNSRFSPRFPNIIKDAPIWIRAVLRGISWRLEVQEHFA